ncbi:MAG TPA: hypothetical protein GXZ89_05695 [Fastidiosipila sp.]|nr:hypothetical protein [Fastidiosipila sp.]
MKRRFPLRTVFAVALVVLLIAGIFSVWFVTRSHWRPVVSEAAFRAAYEKDDRQAVLKMYDEAVEEKNTAPADSPRREAGEKVASAIETTVSEEAERRFQAILDGATLSDDDRAFFSDYDRLSANVLLSSFLDFAYRYLGGEGSDDDMSHMLEQSLRIDVVYRTYGRVGQEYAEMVSTRPKILEAEAIMAESRWFDAVQSWKRLAEDRSIPHFTAGYVAKRSEDAKALLLDESKTIISGLIEQRKFYFARERLNTILPIFPYDQTLLNYNVEIDQHLPKSFLEWDRPVDHIALRPLIADPERAFGGGPYAAAADRLLLLTSEFEAMLKALYDNDYVLVADDLFLTDSGVFHKFKIPEGKKPLVLVFDSFHLATTRYLSGTVEKLALDASGRVVGAMTDEGGETVLREGSDAISILESFIADYPDFSYNGAKATIAVLGQYGLFGYALNETQAQFRAEQRAAHGLSVTAYSEESIEVERKVAKAIADQLVADGYRFASNTYGDLSLPDVSAEAIRLDDETFKAEISPLIGPVNTLVYPGGRHVNTVREKTDLLVDLGYSRLLAKGGGAYFGYGNGYTHIDMNWVNGEVLNNPGESRFNRFFDTSQVIDRAKRP